MQMKKKPWIWLIAVVIVLGIAFAGYWTVQQSSFRGPIQANITLNQESFLIGDEMIMTLDVRVKPGYTAELPAIALPKGLEELRKNTSTVKKHLGSTQYENQYDLTTFTPGEYKLPQLTITYTSRNGSKEKLALPARTIVVKSLLTAEAKDIRDLKPLAKAPLNPLIYYLAMAVILLAALAYLLYRKFWRKKAGEAEPELPPLPAHVVALQKLDELATSDFLEQGEIERYFTALSGIVREYIENRFGAKAQEMTTQEFLERALRKLNLIREHRHLLEEFLVRSDLVKYARHIPQYEEITGAYSTARRFVEETVPQEPVVPEGETPAGVNVSAAPEIAAMVEEATSAGKPGREGEGVNDSESDL